MLRVLPAAFINYLVQESATSTDKEIYSMLPARLQFRKDLLNGSVLSVLPIKLTPPPPKNHNVK